MTRRIVFRAFVAQAVTMLIVGGLSYRYANVFPRWLQVAIIGVSAGLVTVLSTIAVKVLDKFDAVQRDADTVEHAARLNGVYGYIHSARVELVVFFFVTVVLAVTNGVIAVALAKENAVPEPAVRFVVPFGYAGAVFIMLFAIRVTTLFLRVDEFRRQVLGLIRNEQTRLTTLQSIAPSILQPLSTRAVNVDAPAKRSFYVSRRRRRAEG